MQRNFKQLSQDLSKEILKLGDFNVGSGQQDQPPGSGALATIATVAKIKPHKTLRQIKSTPNGIIHILGSCECRQMFPGMVESWSGADELQR